MQLSRRVKHTKCAATGGAPPPRGRGPRRRTDYGDPPSDDGQMFLWIVAVLFMLGGLLGLVWLGGRLQRRNTDALLRRARTMPNVAAQHGMTLPEPPRQPESPGALNVNTSMFPGSSAESEQQPASRAAEPAALTPPISHPVVASSNSESNNQLNSQSEVDQLDSALHEATPGTNQERDKQQPQPGGAAMNAFVQPQPGLPQNELHNRYSGQQEKKLQPSNAQHDQAISRSSSGHPDALRDQPHQQPTAASKAAISPQGLKPSGQKQGEQRAPKPKPGSLKQQMQQQAAGVAHAVQSVFKPLRTNKEQAPEPALEQQAAPQADPIHDSLHKLSDQQISTRKDIGALKRLQRETFQRLLGLDRAVDLLQPKPEPPVAAAAREAERGAGSSPAWGVIAEVKNAALRGRKRTGAQVQAHLDSFCGALWSQGSRERVQQQLAEAGVGGPPVLRARLHSALQDGRGRLVTFLRLPAQASGAEAINANLEKVSCSWRASTRIQLRLLGVGCSAADAAPTLHPLEGKGVTSLMRQGCPAHQVLQGSGLGASYERGRWLLSAAHLLPGIVKGKDGSLLQANVSVTPDITLGLTGIKRSGHNPHAAAPTSDGSMQFLGLLADPHRRAHNRNQEFHARGQPPSDTEPISSRPHQPTAAPSSDAASSSSSADAASTSPHSTAAANSTHSHPTAAAAAGSPIHAASSGGSTAVSPAVDGSAGGDSLQQAAGPVGTHSVDESGEINPLSASSTSDSSSEPVSGSTGGSMRQTASCEQPEPTDAAEDLPSYSGRGLPSGSSQSSNILGPSQHLALTGAVGLGEEAVLAGWVGSEWAGSGAQLNWGLSASLYPDLDGSSAAIAIGRHPAAAATATATDRQQDSPSPLVMEASFQRPLTEGITLSPALVCVRDPCNISIMAGFRLEALF
ncbi:hypothetical protein WJX74_006637 [Apatococcus lobatus]|uniref:Uncharacterized protein n=1 Tax=Apatococcus lobatus TaxID=904363 RepID=A0AAW1QX54_9CHLO